MLLLHFLEPRLHRSCILRLLELGVSFRDLWSVSMIHADILLQWSGESDRSASRQLQRYLKSAKGKNVQPPLDVGRAFLK